MDEIEREMARQHDAIQAKHDEAARVEAENRARMDQFVDLMRRRNAPMTTMLVRKTNRSAKKTALSGTVSTEYVTFYFLDYGYLIRYPRVRNARQCTFIVPGLGIIAAEPQPRSVVMPGKRKHRPARDLTSVCHVEWDSSMTNVTFTDDIAAVDPPGRLENLRRDIAERYWHELTHFSVADLAEAGQQLFDPSRPNSG